MTTKQLTREFNYNGMKIPDPNPSATPQEAVNLLAAGMPELNNAKIEPAKIVGDKQVFTLKVIAETKG